MCECVWTGSFAGSLAQLPACGMLHLFEYWMNDNLFLLDEGIFKDFVIDTNGVIASVTDNFSIRISILMPITRRSSETFFIRKTAFETEG